jgi:hypothetical protein
MKILCSFIVLLLTTTFAPAAVLLDDDWDDGDRTDTNFPEESAWFASSVLGTPTLSALTNSLTGNVLVFETNTSSRLWIAHFSPAGAPTELGLGETLKITLAFTASGVTTNPATTRGLRIGLFNFSETGAARVNADGFSTGAGGGAPGANVTGYMINMNFAQTNTINNPLQIMKRTDLPNINLMGATAVYSSLGTGGGLLGAPAFSNDVPYTMELSVKRLETSVEVTVMFSDTNGWSMSNKVVDASSPNLRFDGFAMRPNGAADSAQSFTFTRFKAETVPFALRFTSIKFDTPEALTLTWDSIPNQAYQVEWRDDLLENSPWNFLGTIIATGTSTSLQDPQATWIQRFYRVIQF